LLEVMRMAIKISTIVLVCYLVMTGTLSCRHPDPGGVLVGRPRCSPAVVQEGYTVSISIPVSNNNATQITVDLNAQLYLNDSSKRILKEFSFQSIQIAAKQKYNTQTTWVGATHTSKKTGIGMVVLVKEPGSNRVQAYEFVNIFFVLPAQEMP
jgi:hypothetical protein